MTFVDGLLGFLVAFVASLALTPLAARLAVRIGAVDAPDDRRKNQERPVPLGGGLAIALATMLGVGVAWAFAPSAPDSVASSFLLGAIPSALVLLVIGLLDDTIGLRGTYKLIGQTMAASLLVSAGFRFQVISLCGWALPLGDLSIPFSLFFCLGAINAFNLIDGADALAASIGAVVCLTMGVIAGTQGALLASLASFGMSGALLGFLRYNAPPARVYLGDTGSMLIGWLVAATAIRSSIKEQAVVALTVPLAICAIPILDVAAALIRRVTTGQSVFTADRGHLHHALMLRGWTVGQTAIAAAGMTAITCAGAMASYLTNNDVYAIVTGGGVILALAGARVFGHAEAALVASHVKTTARSVWRRVRPAASTAGEHTDHAIQIQGRRQWNVLWTALREAAPIYNLGGLKLNVNIPHLHESFFASWRASDAPGGAVWRIALPLTCRNLPVGKLVVEGRTCGAEGLMEMQHVLDFLEPLEAEIQRIVDDAQSLLAADDSTRMRPPSVRIATSEAIAANS